MGTNELETPILRAAVEWSKSEFTAFSLEGFQRVDISAIGDSVRRTGIRGSFRQRLLPRIFYTLRGGFERSRFESFDPGTPKNREDDYIFIRNSLDWKWKRVSAGLFHEFRSNHSNLRSDFKRNQAGFGVTFEY